MKKQARKNQMRLKLDKNGNLTLYTRRGFSIQTNGNLPLTHRDGIGAWTENEILSYLKDTRKL